MALDYDRKKIEKFIVDGIEEILPKSDNRQHYVDFFATLSDKQFDELLDGLEDESIVLAIVCPNLKEGTRLDTGRNLKLAENWGLELFERVWIDPGNGEPKYLSNDRYLIIPLPLCRQAQLLTKKISVPKDNRSVNDFTGQPSGKSESSRISYPETLVLQSFGLDANLTELLKYRGGDIQGMRAMDAMISKTGAVSIDSLAHLNTEVTSTRTLYTLLTGMHLDNTLTK